MAHISPLGAIMIFLCGFGYAKPVNVNPRNFKDPKKGMKRFYTDVCCSSIVLATSGLRNEFVAPKLGVRGVPRYQVLREKQKVLYNREAINYAAHINTLDQVLSGTDVESVQVELDEGVLVCLAGEDWYVTINKQGSIDRYIMKNSNSKNDAINEVQAALAYLRENLSKEMKIANNVLGM
jgi:hypothetical protein